MRLAVGLVVFVASVVSLAVLSGIAFHGLSEPVALGVLCAAAALGGLAAWQTRGSRDDLPSWRDPLTAGMFLVFALAVGRAFVWLIYPDGDSWMILSPYNLGDLALHIAFIRYLASGVPFWPESPILVDSPLVYPVGMDLFNSVLLLTGVPLVQGLIWCGLLGGALAAWALWRWAGVFGMAAFLFSGGLAAFAMLGSGDWALRDFSEDMQWKNAFLTMFVTQRNFLYFLPAGLILLMDWRARLRGGAGVLPFWVGLVIYSTMPLFSAHAFLFFSACLVGVFLASLERNWRVWVILGFSALVPATFAMALVTGGFSVSGSIRWHPGWMQEDSGWTFWLWNFGLMIPVWIATVVLIIRRRDVPGLALTVPATLIFLACLFIAFAPWPWDNTKLMIWSWLVIVPWIADLVIKPLARPAQILICFGLFFTGAVSLMAGLDGRHGYQLAVRSELAAVEKAIKDIPISARFAAAPDYAHPLLLLGRKVAIGYTGHLWSHGLDYQEKEALLTQVMLGGTEWKTHAHELGVDQIFWSLREARRFPASTEDWAFETGDYDPERLTFPVP